MTGVRSAAPAHPGGAQSDGRGQWSGVGCWSMAPRYGRVCSGIQTRGWNRTRSAA